MNTQIEKADSFPLKIYGLKEKAYSEYVQIFRLDSRNKPAKTLILVNYRRTPKTL